MLLLVILLFGACQTNSRTSWDFTTENVFTPGIEGPAVNSERLLFAVNFEKEGTIGVVDETGEGKVFLELPEGSIGNGIRFDSDGNMFIADYAGHKVYRVARGSDIPEVWAEEANMNQPNDLTLGRQGQIYLSDPDWSINTGKIWMVDQQRNVVLLEDKMGTTNGIELSPDGNILYVNESIQRKVWKYDILPGGAIGNKELLISFKDFGLDGMRCDEKGNLYITRFEKGTVVVVSPEGKILDEIELKGKKPSNITFGGEDWQTCYVTMADRGCVEAFRALYPRRSN
ncbi:SMP-30/gluconolactonase/LRE family protein [Lentiprolixibacter aurantiacus]|uniref:SMP-30/gluconolactonase/LRE family protein n=1 Tax=Lentiprolixibacter aurantiacus TaxID=2993939 RepID=A0AAE3MJJ8_9FLAO|nr:SMP-30/gluconolactonase/LRE family protein [Lentiprolixibacter aurantiacus]MCX2718491.1 SMP-30/gluconolactonase/LRE family protein [Lentiprolixibacter aurantiacus]